MLAKRKATGILLWTCVIVIVLYAIVLLANFLRETEVFTALSVKIDTVTLGKEYRIYLTGDAEQARQSLLKSVRLIETMKFAEDKRAEGLCLSYGRLYMLETRMGRTQTAAAYWLKSQYWLLRKYELWHWQEDVAASEVLSRTPQHTMEMLDTFDKHRTNGAGPHYLSQLRATTRERTSPTTQE